MKDLYKHYSEMSRDDLIEELLKSRQKNFLASVLEENSSLFLNSPVITFIVAASNHEIVAANDLFLKTFALPYRAVAGHKLQSLKIWPCYSALKSFFAYLALPAQPPKEITFLNSKKETLHLQISSVHCQKKNGTFIVVWGNDITKLTESKKKLTEKNKIFSTILENSPAIISRFDRSLTCVYANKAIEKLTGGLAGSPIGQTLQTLNLPKSFRRLWTTHLANVFKTKKPVVFTAKYRSPFGKETFYQSRFVPEAGSHGDVRHVLCTTYDITALKRAEQYLRIHQARSAWYLNAIPDILFKCDMDGNYLDCSGAQKKFFGLTKNGIIGKNASEILPPAVAGQIMKTIRLAYATGATQSFEYSQSINKKERCFEARVSSIPRTKEFLLTLRDITEHKTLRRKIEHLNRLQLAGEIASTIGHEIRNPLTTVCGFLQFMQSKEEYKNWSAQFNLMLTELEHSNHIITKLLSLAHDKTPLAQRQCLDELITGLKL